MKRTPVDSSSIKSIGHEGSTLHVEFTNGGVYEYKKVPAALAQKLMSAGSVGGYFAANVRGAFTARKLP